MTHLLRPNTRSGSRKNIHAHYDLGNEFYRHWLDGTMTYSSALFDGDNSLSLEAAQDAKYERILQVLDPRPGERILETGCGWGGFAEYVARTRGVAVHGITVSQAQLAHAQARIDRQGLDALVDLALPIIVTSPAATTMSCPSRCSRRWANASGRLISGPFTIA